jgi:hypothetical protein
MFNGSYNSRLDVKCVHKGNIYTLRKQFLPWELLLPWNLEKLGIKTGLLNEWINSWSCNKLHIKGISGHMVFLMTKDDYIRRLVWIVLCYVLTMFLLFIRCHIDGSKSFVMYWLHMKGVFKASYVLGAELHR